MIPYIIPLVLVSTNYILELVVKFFCKLHRYETKTQQYQAFINIQLIISFANSALMPYIVHAICDKDFSVNNKVLLRNSVY